MYHNVSDVLYRLNLRSVGSFVCAGWLRAWKVSGSLWHTAPLERAGRARYRTGWFGSSGHPVIQELLVVAQLDGESVSQPRRACRRGHFDPLCVASKSMFVVYRDILNTQILITSNCKLKNAFHFLSGNNCSNCQKVHRGKFVQFVELLCWNCSIRLGVTFNGFAVDGSPAWNVGIKQPLRCGLRCYEFMKLERYGKVQQHRRQFDFEMQYFERVRTMVKCTAIDYWQAWPLWLA